MENFYQPKIKTEKNKDDSSAKIIGLESFLFSSLVEILRMNNLKVNEGSAFDYFFQLGEFEKTPKFLAEAKESGAKFFLIIEKKKENKTIQRVEQLVLKELEEKKIDGKIISLTGKSFSEMETVKKILRICFSRGEEKALIIKNEESLEEMPSAKVSRKRIFWIPSFFLFFLLLPLIMMLINLGIGVWNFKQIQKESFSLNLEKAEKRVLVSQSSFNAARNNWRFYPMIGSWQKKTDFYLTTGLDLSLSAKHLIETAKEIKEALPIVLNQKPGDFNSALPKINANLQAADEELALIEARKIDLPFFGKLTERIKSLRQKIQLLKNFLTMTPLFFNDKTYLVLLQNNFELRPTGGFIGSFGLLSFRDGQMELRVEDVYMADGQLKGHVEPPKPIREYLNQIHWYLRDSNFNPDFKESAKQALWFLEKELGVRADGVIALDLETIKKILKLTGPVEVSDYQEKITAENFFLKTQGYSQNNFFGGSTQKKDFLSSLATALFEKISKHKEISYEGLLKTVGESLVEKHLLFFFEKDQLQALVENKNWAGTIKQNDQCQMTNDQCIDDFLMVVDANLGVNKANYFVKREIGQKIELQEKSLKESVKITYFNSSPLNLSFAGSYKNYLRVLIGDGAIINKVNFDGQEFKGKIDQEKISGKISLGLWFEVLPISKKEIEIFYERPLEKQGTDTTYNLLVQKQSGTDKDLLTIASNFDLSYNGDLLVDRMFQVRLK